MVVNGSSTASTSTSNTNNIQNGFKEDAGVKYIQRPIQLTKQQKQLLLQEARKRRTQILQTDCNNVENWHTRGFMDYNDVHVTSKKDDNNPFCMTKGITNVPTGITLHDIREQFESDFRSNDSIRRVYPTIIDPMNIDMIIVGNITNNNNEDDEDDQLLDTSCHEALRLLWGVFYVAPMISDRDFYFVQHTSLTTCPVTGDEVFCSNSFSIDPLLFNTDDNNNSEDENDNLIKAVPDMQTTLGRIRAEIQLTGYIYRHDKIKNKLSMAFIGQCDPKGYLPASIVNFASISQAMNIGRVRDHYQRLINVNDEFVVAATSKKEEQDKNAEASASATTTTTTTTKTKLFPFDCYVIPRRGGSILHSIPLIISDNSNNNNNNKSDDQVFVRLQAHCDHGISVQLKNIDTDIDTLTITTASSATAAGAAASDLAEGKLIKFGGKGNFILDITLQIKMNNMNTNSNEHILSLEFINPGWKKATLCLPAKTTITISSTTVEEDTAQ